MKVTPVPHGLEHLIGKNAPGYVRGEGLHMSTIYNDMYQDLEPKRYVRGSEPDSLRLEAGLAFEDFLEHAIKERLTPGSGRPGEFVEPEHGIIFSPDLILFNGHPRVGEIKLTWMSSKDAPRLETNGLPPKWDKWVTQMACYSYCLDTPCARLIGFFVNGNYKWLRRKKDNLPDGPELLAWDLEFTPRELREHWQEVINHARYKEML